MIGWIESWWNSVVPDRGRPLDCCEGGLNDFAHQKWYQNRPHILQLRTHKQFA